MSQPDTIVALATPPGRGGIGIVRISGPRARDLAEPVLRLSAPLAAGRARFAHLLDPTALGCEASAPVLDQAVVTYFAAPHSYTGEDVVEIALHGAPVLMEAVLRYAVERGARIALPGEFTQRAFLSGRLDLTAAEAVRDLIDAATLHQARVAAAQLGGSISRAVSGPKAELVGLIAALEAGIDFAEDDVETMSAAEIVEAIGRVRVPLDALADGFTYGRTLREGVTVALVGRPNAGKSSLFNRLLGRDRAIVTAQPGTTRDLLAERWTLGQIPVELVDTAGLRVLADEAVHEAELAGMARTRFAMAEAQHTLLLVDAAALRGLAVGELPPADGETLATMAGRPTTLVLTKVDLLDDAERERMGAAYAEAVLLSSKTGEGLDRLRERLTLALGVDEPTSDTALVTSLRQQNAIDQARAGLRHAGANAAGGAPHEVVLLDLHMALQALDELTGQTTAESILQQIFSTFCIGK